MTCQQMMQIVNMYDRNCEIRTIPTQLVWKYMMVVHPKFDFQSRGNHAFEDGTKVPYMYRVSRNRRGDIVKETLILGDPYGMEWKEK